MARSTVEQATADSSPGSPRAAAPIGVDDCRQDDADRGASSGAKTPHQQPAPATSTVPCEEPADGPASPTTSERPHVAAPDKAVDAAIALDRQAGQLAELLEQRLRDLDRREALLHAEAAEIESATRAARLWAQQRVEELEAREAAVARRESQLAAREAKATAMWKQSQQDASDVERRRAHLERAEERLSRQQAAYREAMAKLDVERAALRRQQRLERQRIDRYRVASQQIVRQLLAGVERRRQSLAGAAPRNAALQNEDHRALPTTQTPGRLRAWQQRLSAQQADLAISLEQLARQQALLAEDRRELEAQRIAWQQQQAKAVREQQARQDVARAELTRRREQIEQQEKALTRLRDEVSRMHRQTLELRLIAEELWADFADRVPSAAVVRRLGALRRQLTDQYRFALDAMDEKRRQLEALCRHLELTHASFDRHRKSIEGWFQRRRHELDARARRLAAQQEQLVERESKLRRELEGWREQRTRMEAELHRLRATQSFDVNEQVA